MAKASYLTKATVEQIFFRDYKDQLNIKDQIANKELWSNYTDRLCKDGYISPNQYRTWHYPRSVYFLTKRK